VRAPHEGWLIRNADLHEEERGDERDGGSLSKGITLRRKGGKKAISSIAGGLK